MAIPGTRAEFHNNPSSTEDIGLCSMYRLCKHPCVYSVGRPVSVLADPDTCRASNAPDNADSAHERTFVGA